MEDLDGLISSNKLMSNEWKKYFYKIKLHYRLEKEKMEKEK